MVDRKGFTYDVCPNWFLPEMTARPNLFLPLLMSPKLVFTCNGSPNQLLPVMYTKTGFTCDVDQTCLYLWWPTSMTASGLTSILARSLWLQTVVCKKAQGQKVLQMSIWFKWENESFKLHTLPFFRYFEFWKAGTVNFFSHVSIKPHNLCLKSMITV